MENNNYIKETANTKSTTGAVAQSFLANVFTYMSAALAITGLVAYIFGTDTSLMSLMFTETGMNMFGYIIMFAPFGMVLWMSAKFKSFSSSMLLVLFIVFSILMGMSLSTIFLVYTGASIFSTFLITSGTFAIMAFLGHTTKTDLTKFGSILMMGVIGIIIAMVVNMFMQSAMMDYIISGIGVLIFTGLIAYDT